MKGLTVDDARRAVWHLRHGGVEGVRTWARRRAVDRRPTVAGRVDRGGRVSFAPWPLDARPPARPGLRVGVVLDDFSRLALRYEWDQVELQPSSWRAELSAEPVDLLFVESAWAGNGGGWRYHLTGPSAPRPALVELVGWCRERGIPTVFWNKEDPAHFDDFLATARLFDHVFTTDVRRVDAYRERLEHDRVGVLPFAAQPAIHNPVRSGAGHQTRDVAFAGMYFAHRHPERREQMDVVLGGALDASERMAGGLEIFSRQLGGDERYQFPEPYRSRVVGSLGYPEMLSAYRAYKVFLNVNTVVDSPSMCARRIFEITASGTPVVSGPSAAVGAFFPATQVSQVGTRGDAAAAIRALVRSPELRDRTVHLAQRAIWSQHTYGHRVDTVLAAVGLPAPTPARTVSAVVSTNRPGRLEQVLATIGRQAAVAPQLVLVAHGFALDRADVLARAHDAGIRDTVLLEAGADVPLGECLNLGVRAASGDVVAKVDDDDLYGGHYLVDQLHALAYSGADVVGKQAHYLHLESLDATVLRFAEREHRFTDLVMGPTIVARRDLALEVPFPAVPRGEDTGFLRATVEAGGTVYSADRFNFVQVRRADGGHTWQATDSDVLASATVHHFGFSNDHVMF